MNNILRKRGQAALEFLTTYGWAFLVILVMIGALAYFGVLNPQKILPNKCVFQTGIDCGRYIIEQDGTVDFAVPGQASNLVVVELTNNLPDHTWVHPEGIEYYSPIAGRYVPCHQRANGMQYGVNPVINLSAEPVEGGRQWNRQQLITIYCSAPDITVVTGDKAKVELRVHYNPGAQIDTRFDTYINGDVLVQAN